MGHIAKKEIVKFRPVKCSFNMLLNFFFVQTNAVIGEMPGMSPIVCCFLHRMKRDILLDKKS